MTVQIEPKVQAATGGASAAAAVCWVLTHFVFHGTLPVPVEGLVDVIVPGVTALLGGYFTPHQNRLAPGTVLRVSGNLATAPAAAAIVQHLRTGQIQLANPTPSPVRPAVAAQPATPNPEENQMSLSDAFRAAVEQFRGDVLPKVAPEAVDEFHALVDTLKGQFGKVLAEAGHAAQADVATAATDVAQLATDSASAVAPAPAEGAPESPADPAAPTA